MERKPRDLMMRGFLEAQQRHLERNARLPQVALVELVDRAYEKAHIVLTSARRPKWLFLTFSLCHEALLTAAATILRGQPDHAAGSTRRALEAAKHAFAFLYDPKNRDRWGQYEHRLGRWQRRQAGEHPGRLKKPDLKLPRPHPNLEKIEAQIGMLSDAAVHFTPEYLEEKDFVPHPGGGVALPYFVNDPEEIGKALRNCVATHKLILILLNDGLSNAFGLNTAFLEAMNALEAAHARLYPEPPKP